MRDLSGLATRGLILMLCSLCSPGIGENLLEPKVPGCAGLTDARKLLPVDESIMCARGPHNEQKGRYAFKFDNWMNFRSGRHALPFHNLTTSFMETRAYPPKQSIRNFSKGVLQPRLFTFYTKNPRWDGADSCPCCGLAEQTGRQAERGGRRKRTMNNLRMMPHDLSTSFVLRLIWIPQEVVALTGSLSSQGRGPLTVTGVSRGQMRACVGVSVRQCQFVCGCA